MIRLFASFLVALALFFSPMAMEMGGGMAMGHSTMAQMDGGCTGMDHSSPDEQKSDMKMACAIACAALPGSPACLAEQTSSPKPANVALAAQVLTGIWPEGETPPPRIAPEI
jgi:hypothetical protein